MKNRSKIKKEEIVHYFQRLKPEIEKIIEEYLPQKISKRWLEFTFGKPDYLFSPQATQGALLDPIGDFFNREGKKWRPILFLLITEAIGGETKTVKDFAIIPELIHNGTLIFDDIQDQGELRRGKPCLHKIFGIDIASNAGMFLLFFPLLVLVKNRTKFKPETLVRVYETYIQEMINLSLGQGTDIYWHKGEAKEIDEKEYFQMCAFKTGGISRMLAKMAALLSEGNEELTEKVGRLAEAIGITFQIQDDILDLTLVGKAREQFGKSFGNDIKEGKRTLMVIQTLKKANQKDKKRLVEILNKHTADLREIREAIAIIKKYKSLNYAKKVSQKIIQDAWQEAEKFLPESQAKKRLKDFIHYLIKRKR